MFKAYFADNRTISDSGVIASLAGDCGLDPVEFATEYRAREQALGAAVIRDHDDAVRLGINAVPTIVVDDRVSIPGAQDTATYIRVLEQLLSEGQ